MDLEIEKKNKINKEVLVSLHTDLLVFVRGDHSDLASGLPELFVVVAHSQDLEVEAVGVHHFHSKLGEEEEALEAVDLMNSTVAVAVAEEEVHLGCRRVVEGEEVGDRCHQDSIGQLQEVEVDRPLHSALEEICPDHLEAEDLHWPLVPDD